MVVQVARYVGRSLTRRYHKRKVKIPKIKCGVPVISFNLRNSNEFYKKTLVKFINDFTSSSVKEKGFKYENMDYLHNFSSYTKYSNLSML